MDKKQLGFVMILAVVAHSVYISPITSKSKKKSL
jgi:hypothetical protein